MTSRNVYVIINQNLWESRVLHINQFVKESNLEDEAKYDGRTALHVALWTMITAGICLFGLGLWMTVNYASKTEYNPDTGGYDRPYHGWLILIVFAVVIIVLTAASERLSYWFGDIAGSAKVIGKYYRPAFFGGVNYYLTVEGKTRAGTLKQRDVFVDDHDYHEYNVGGIYKP